MALYLNTNAAFKDFQMLRNDRYFVDKSAMIQKVNERVNTKNRFLCITKPRRFGKTSALNMLGAYYGKAYSSKELFDHLKISRSQSYPVHMNQYNLISFSMNELSGQGNTYLDYIFSHELYQENQRDFLEFLRNLLKDRSYVALAYMTGVLPIKKYSTGSALNMFDEYTMLNDCCFDEYFGFTEQEAEMLCCRQSQLTLTELAEWYNGYSAWDGRKLYNPRSVVLALINGICRSYWTRTGKLDEVLFFLKYNLGEVRDDVIKMVNHMPVKIDISEEYAAGQKSPSNREEIYAAMLVYGLLSYYDGELRIPNKELMLEFQKALKDEEFGYVAELVRNSNEMLNATLEKREEAVAAYLHDIHNSKKAWSIFYW